MPDDLAIALNLPSEAVSQYTDFPFTGACVFNNVPLAIAADGIYQLETGELDACSQITACVEFPKTDFGSPNVKRIRSLYVGYRSEDDLELTVIADDGNPETHVLNANLSSRQAGARVPIGGLVQGVYWTIAVRNVSGGNFTLNSVEALLIQTSRKYS